MYCANPDGINLDRVLKKCQFPLLDMNLVDNSSIEKSKGQYLIAKDEDGNEEFICIRLPSRQSNMLKKKRPNLRAVFQKALKIKLDVSRGSKSNGVTDRYIMYGYRKEPKGSDIGEYSFHPDSSEKDREDMSAEVANFVGSLEKLASPFVSPSQRQGFNAMKSNIELPSVSGADASFATQFSVGKNYWSPVHDDDDFFWTVLSVLDMNGKCRVDVPLHWFIFPEYKVAVPLNVGDILIFNPRILHSSSNQTENDTFIFSAYVSSKTVAARGSNAASSSK